MHVTAWRFLVMIPTMAGVVSHGVR